MKYQICSDERWPDFSLAESGDFGFHADRAVEIPDELVERYAKAEVEYEAVQGELREIFERALKRPNG